ncbi:beta-carotene 15,15'-monooxygenase [Sphingobacteriaceae bacterium WQ 2009]|uniref:Beta-carotene 15,15'-monooxygenase n=1 Tax=Rhinopithecimicrobium faecis TaxID=2820698 RepID=A0A8T4H8F6_9SPHI|nr:beta-carotene 15,15'-monooxygenase [Sphingobacteriaceae bacterium WQ 2009]
MLISQFRKYTPINFIVLALVGLCLCLGVYLHLPTKLTAILFEPALSNLIGVDKFSTLTPEVNVMVTLFLTLLQAFILNRVMNHFNILGKPNFLTALMYMTLASLFLPFLVLSPTLICNFISIWMISKLLNIYRQVDIKGLMFELGMIVAIGSLIYFPFIIMGLLLWVSLIIFRPFNWREWFTPLLGFSTIYFLLAVVYFWLGRMEEFYLIWVPLTYKFSTSLKMEVNDYFVVIPIIFTLLLFLVILKDNFFRSIVHVRKSFQLLFFMLILSFVSFYWKRDLSVNHFLMCATPITVYLAYYFTHSKKKWLFESVYAVIILTILYFQFF